MDMDLLKQRLVEYGLDLGFGLVRVTTALPLELWNCQVAIRKEKDPETAYRWENMKYDPKEIIPEANSIVVAVWPHIPHKTKFPDGIARFSAYYREYPKGRDAAMELGEFLKKIGYQAVIHPPLPAKEIAHRAGVGYYGKNALIHTAEFGSWISIHYILTDAKLPPDDSMDEISDCGDCNLCMKACPTGAIEQEGQVMVSKCIRHHMLSSDFIPMEIRDKMGNGMLGCDICQIVCPFNKEGISQATLPSQKEMDLFNVGDILKEWPMGLKNRMKDLGKIIGSNYARSQKVLSACVILAGNSKDKSYLPSLKELLKHPHPPIRGHSAWAMGKIGSAKCRDILSQALDKEEDPRVREEIYNAINSCK